MQEKKPKTTIEPESTTSSTQRHAATAASHAAPAVVSHAAPAAVPHRSSVEDVHTQKAADKQGIGQAVREPNVENHLPFHQKIVLWVHQAFPGHEHAFYGGVIGLVVAILFILLDFWVTLEIVIFSVAGVAIGQLFDGNPRIIRAIRSLFEPRN